MSALASTTGVRVARSESRGTYRRAWRAILRLRLALIDRRKYQRVTLEHVDRLPLVVLPDVFNPALLRSGAFFVDQLRDKELVPYGATVLDLGCGSGAAGIWCAVRRGCEVVASDINPSAVRCTRINALLNRVDLDVREGDLFAPMSDDRFDAILFNPPYYRGTPRDALDHAWRSPDVLERFASELPGHLTADGCALIVLSSDGDSGAVLCALEHNGFRTEVAARRDFINEVMTVYRVSAC